MHGEPRLRGNRPEGDQEYQGSTGFRKNDGQAWFPGSPCKHSSYSGFVEVPRSAPYPTECSSPLFPLVHHERIIVGVRPFRREILPADLFPFRRVVFREPDIPFHFRMDFGEIEPVRFR